MDHSRAITVTPSIVSVHKECVVVVVGAIAQWNDTRLEANANTLKFA